MNACRTKPKGRLRGRELRAKCRVCLAWLIKRLLCRLITYWLGWIVYVKGARVCWHQTSYSENGFPLSNLWMSDFWSFAWTWSAEWWLCEQARDIFIDGAMSCLVMGSCPFYFFSIIFSKKRCIFDLNNMTRLIRTLSMGPSAVTGIDSNFLLGIW